MPRFINKHLHRKDTTPRKFSKKPIYKPLLKVEEATVPDDKNKDLKKEEKMNDNIEKLKKIVGDNAEIPERKTKKVKKNTGLIERTESSAILINEDNKMILND